MKHSEKTEQLFQQVLDETPPDIKLQIRWLYDIADRIDAALQQRGLTQKEFAKFMGTSEAAVSHWVGGGHNFKLSTLVKISTVLGKPIITASHNLIGTSRRWVRKKRGPLRPTLDSTCQLFTFLGGHLLRDGDDTDAAEVETIKKD